MNPVRLRIIALLLISLAIRLAWGLAQPPEPTATLPDQKEYLAIARNMLIGQGLRFRDDRFGADEVVAFRSPGYPAFIAMLTASPQLVRIGQAVLDTSTVLAMYLLAKRWMDERAALGAAALVGLNPFLIFFTGVILSETLFTAALAWGVSLLGRRYLVGVLPLAIAVIVRPAAVMFAPLACVLVAWPSVWKMIGWTIVGAAVSILTLLPWAYRNHEMLDQWIWSTTNTGQTAYDGFRPGATGASDLSELPKMPELRGLSEVSRNALLAKRGRDYMMQDLPRSLGLAVRKVARTWSPVPLSDEYASTRNRIVGLLYTLPVFVLVLIALFRRTIPLPLKALCLLPAVYFTAGVAVTVGSIRYRLPAEPPMIVLAASVFKRNTSQEISRVLSDS